MLKHFVGDFHASSQGLSDFCHRPTLNPQHRLQSPSAEAVDSLLF